MVPAPGLLPCCSRRVSVGTCTTCACAAGASMGSPCSSAMAASMASSLWKPWSCGSTFRSWPGGIQGSCYSATLQGSARLDQARAAFARGSCHCRCCCGRSCRLGMLGLGNHFLHWLNHFLHWLQHQVLRRRSR